MQHTFEQVDNYIAGLLATEDLHLQNVLTSLTTNNIPHESVSPNQGKLIQMLAIATGAKRILELGTLGGYSTIWLARSLPEDGKLISIEFNERHATVARQNIEAAGLADKVEIRVGKAIDHIETIYNNNEGPFDFFFIDADKPPYTEYFQWAVKLSRKGSIIVCDNVVRNGKVLDAASTDEKVKGVQRFNQYLSTCKEVSATILQTVGVKEYDGMAIAVVK